MSDQNSDDNVIDLKEESECRRWSRKFGVRPKALKAAMRFPHRG